MPKLSALPFVRAGVSEGLSANQAFRNYQAERQIAEQETGQRWTAGRRSVFLQLYSEVRSARGQVPEALTAPRDVPGGGLEEIDRSTVRTSGFVNWAVAFVRPVGSSDVERWTYFQRSNEPLTPEETEALARADIEASQVEEHGSAHGMVIEGVTWTGYQKLIPREGL